MTAVTRSKYSEHHSESGLGWNELPFADSEAHEVEESRWDCAKKNRGQRRQDKARGTPVPEPDCEELIVILSDIAQLQRQDLYF